MLAIRCLALAALSAAAMGCGDVNRSNPLDPRAGNFVNLSEQIIGSWSRAEAEGNEVYTFRLDKSVQLRDFSAPGGGPIDRNASFPLTLAVTFTGTYTLVGNELRALFTQVQSNDPSGAATPALPRGSRTVPIIIKSNTLILRELDGDRLYTRL